MLIMFLQGRWVGGGGMQAITFQAQLELLESVSVKLVNFHFFFAGILPRDTARQKEHERHGLQDGPHQPRRLGGGDGDRD